MHFIQEIGLHGGTLNLSRFRGYGYLSVCHCCYKLPINICNILDEISLNSLSYDELHVA